MIIPAPAACTTLPANNIGKVGEIAHINVPIANSPIEVKKSCLVVNRSIKTNVPYLNVADNFAFERHEGVFTFNG